MKLQFTPRFQQRLNICIDNDTRDQLNSLAGQKGLPVSIGDDGCD
jgi:hypothetical protein